MGKLSPRGKKCIFIRYSEFPTKGEIDKDFQFYEMEDPDDGASSYSVEGLEETLNPLENNGSDFVPNLTLM